MKRKEAENRTEMFESLAKGSERNLREFAIGASNFTANKENYHQDNRDLLSIILSRKNLLEALHRVESNKGSAGVDGMDVKSLRLYLKENWLSIKSSILNEEFSVQPIKRVMIPKNGSKEMRGLGIPTVLDRLIQQAIHQILDKIFDPSFSDLSFGFRKGRSCHDALKQAKSFVSEGNRWVVDLDIRKFFDRVNHDILMSRLALKIKDKKVLRLIRKYLQAGVMENDVMSSSFEGTPQGGPLSPLLSNILLDDLDKELEKRGHNFCRYADDCNIYLRSKKAGERVLVSISNFLNKKLKLDLNMDKSKVSRPWTSEFLGFTMSVNFIPKLKPTKASIKRFRQKAKKLFRMGRGRNLEIFIKFNLNPFLIGWVNYFRLSDTKNVFEEQDMWIRRRLRCIIWKQWKRPYTRFRKMMKLGLGEKQAYKSAFNGRGAWWNSRSSHLHWLLKTKFFNKRGLTSLLDRVRSV